MNIRRTLAALPGWRTKRKLIVLESDDWGSIRMPSVEAYNNLQKAGIDLISDEEPFLINSIHLQQLRIFLVCLRF